MGFFSSLFGSNGSHSKGQQQHRQRYDNNKGPTPTTTASAQFAQQPTRNVQDAVVICYNQRYHDVHFRDFPNGMRQATVADLKERCKRLTGVTLATMKLKVSGAYIKDDNATLIGSGIHEGSLVHVIGDTANREEINQTASKNPEEVGYLNRVSKAMEILDNAKLKIKEFEDAISELKSMPPQQREKQNKTQELGIYLTEILMQALISLDAVDCPPEFQTARSSRKEAVKKCQLLMDHVDSLRSELKQYVSLEDQQQRL